MRWRLDLTDSSDPLPFNYQHSLTGVLHKWLGPNDVHDDASLYGHSFLSGARPSGTGLRFPRGASWTIGFHDPSLAQRLLAGIMDDPHVHFGMRVYNAQEEAIPVFGTPQRFLVNGLVLARAKRDDKTTAHLIWSDPDSDEALTRVLRWKLKQAGFEGVHLDAQIGFDRSYQRARTRLAEIKGISYRGSECPVIVRGTPEAIRFAYVVGAGDLTGSGFGALTF